jgi:hypothetical protein
MGSNFTLTDVTAATWKTLSNPPDGLMAPVEPSSLCLQNTDNCKKETANRKDDKGFYSRNKDWSPGPLPNMTNPISWPFTKSPIFKKSPTATYQILDLNFVASPPAGFTVKIYKVEFKAGQQLSPRFVGVAFPMDLDISKLPPFLVHYKHVPGQDPSSSLFKYFNPLGYDWLFYELWGWMNYNAKQVGTKWAVDMPFLSLMQSSFGFCYQLRQANKQYVIVLPHISRVFDGASGKLKDFQLYSAQTLREILIDIQKDILNIKDEKLETVAISANSSGCNVLSTFLTENVKAAATSKPVEEFMKNELNEIFILDPPENFGDAMVNSMTGWKALANNRDSSRKKCVRFYTHSFTKNFEALSGTKGGPFTKGANGFWESSDKTVSLAYLPFVKSGDDVWQRTHDEILGNGDTISTFAFVHHVIPALFLTDAARRSLFV